MSQCRTIYLARGRDDADFVRKLGEGMGLLIAGLLNSRDLVNFSLLGFQGPNDWAMNEAINTRF